MPQTFNRIWIHAFFSTHEKKPIITQKIENKLFHYIGKLFVEMKCHVVIINGTNNQVHCLFLLNARASISETIKNIKGNSSHYINQHNLTREKFSWQVGYSAFSVSESNYSLVYQFIKNLSTHQKTLKNPYEGFINLYND